MGAVLPSSNIKSNKAALLTQAEDVLQWEAGILTKNGYILGIMTIADVKQMSLSEKLQIMEAIWEDLREHVDSCPVSPQTRKLLDKRRERVASGEVSVRDWDDVKHSIGRS